ncbi:hypothetical protein BU16DRAFT_350195 [Lophium mytilinum]|uniref:Uncharacterized protein n=1 Tax=Lophium mytilinum TaxID=390894 RepID=A0A6A6QY05_9PEZI|nr:hypothetical protein BU16DRAFT_350195 [Lophium mytilinum]
MEGSKGRLRKMVGSPTSWWCAAGVLMHPLLDCIEPGKFAEGREVLGSGFGVPCRGFKGDEGLLRVISVLSSATVDPASSSNNDVANRGWRKARNGNSAVTTFTVLFQQFVRTSVREASCLMVCWNF